MTMRDGGVEEELLLVEPGTGQPDQAATVAKTLLDHVRDALDEAGDTAAVSDLLAEVLTRGNGPPSSGGSTAATEACPR
jgi:glutamate---cysteine ligase / carboxylate-amine ligase